GSARVADDQYAFGDRGRGDDAAGGDKVPQLPARLEVQDVEVFVLAADIDTAAADDGGRIDVAARGKRPELLSGGQFEAIDVPVARAHNDDARVGGGRAVDHRLVLHAGKLPELFLAVAREADHLSTIGADDDLVGKHGRRTGAERAHFLRENLFSVCQINRAQLGVAAGDEHARRLAVLARADRRRSVHAVAGLGVPELFSIGGIQAEDVGPIGAEDDLVAQKVGGGMDAGAGIEGPELDATVGLHGVEHAVLVTDVDDAIDDGGAGFKTRLGPVGPLALAGLEIDRPQRPTAVGGVNGAVHDGD